MRRYYSIAILFNLFNTRSGCKVRKFFVTLRSKRRKKLDREEKGVISSFGFA